MSAILQLLLCAAGVSSTLSLHFVALGLLFRGHDKQPNLRWATLVAFALLLMHLVEIGIYAVLYHLGTALELGALRGEAAQTLGGYIYFSAITYTTVGFGDITPSAGLRMLAAVEALNGIILVGVTTSALLVIMSRALRQKLSASLVE